MTEDTYRQRAARLFDDRRQHFLENGSKSIYWLNIKSGIHHINCDYVLRTSNFFDDGLDLHLQHVWWEVIEGAKLWAAEDELAHYRLVAMVAGARARGTLQRSINAGAEESEMESFMTSDGAVWTDLPFFRPAIYEAWRGGCREMGPEAWKNLNAFAAKLTGVGAVNLMPMGLWTIRDALEIPRHFSTTELGEDVFSEDEPTVEDLLPAAMFWFKNTSHILRTMLKSRAARKYLHEGIPEEVAVSACEVGILAKNSEVLLEDISISRWEYWKRRLLSISRLKNDDGEHSPHSVLALEAYTLLNSWDV